MNNQKIIRVRQENLNAVLAAIPGSIEVPAPDYIDYGVGDYLIQGRDPDDLGSYSDYRTAPALGMCGVQLPPGMSGTQAHKIIQKMKTATLFGWAEKEIIKLKEQNDEN